MGGARLMPGYALLFVRSARKELESLPLLTAGRVLKRLESLQQTPRPPGAVKLETADALWRIRVGDLRVIYAVNDRAREVEVRIIRHRREVYR